MITTLRPATRRAKPSDAARASHWVSPAAGGAGADEVYATELDLRFRSPPPKPVPAIVAAMEAIPAGRPQYVRTWDDPAELLSALRTRGIDGHSLRLADGTWRTRLLRAS